MRIGLDLGSTGAKFALESGMVGIVPAVVGDASEIWHWEDDYIQVGDLFVGKAAMAGASWFAQVMLENKGKEEDAKIAQALGYGSIGAMLLKMGMASLQVGRLFGVW